MSHRGFEFQVEGFKNWIGVQVDTKEKALELARAEFGDRVIKVRKVRASKIG